jgi:hypothetical protein
LADFSPVFLVELQVSNFQFFFQTPDFIFYIFNKFELFLKYQKSIKISEIWIPYNPEV